MRKRIVRSLIISLVLSLLLFFLILYKQQSRFWTRRVPDGNPSSQNDEKIVCKDCNVILITMTNLRYDHMSSNGYSRLTTPNLDTFAKESLVFDNAFAHSSWTLPEGISIYTGLYPYQHGIMNRYDGSKLPSTTPTLIDILNANGYQTAAFTGGFDYNPEFGLTNRFSYHKECPKKEAGERGQPVMVGPNQYGEFGCTVSQAVTWLKENINNKFFIHVQGFDAHCPFSQKGGKIYDPNYQGIIDYSDCLWTFDRSVPTVKNGRIYYPVYSAKSGTEQNVLLNQEDINHLVAIYDEGITFADQKIGQFLEEVKQLGLLNNTIIIFSSEHGDMFGKYGRFMRGGPLRGTFYDDVLHVPLIIKHPKILPKTLDGLVQHIDILPSLLDFLGLKFQSNFSGMSLVPDILLHHDVNAYVFAGSEFTPDSNNTYFSKKSSASVIRSKQWKLIQETIYDITPSQTVELYDIVNDKEELQNLADKRQDILRDMQSRLDKWLRSVRK